MQYIITLHTTQNAEVDTRNKKLEDLVFKRDFLFKTYQFKKKNEKYISCISVKTI